MTRRTLMAGAVSLTALGAAGCSASSGPQTIAALVQTIIPASDGVPGALDVGALEFVYAMRSALPPGEKARFERGQSLFEESLDGGFAAASAERRSVHAAMLDATSFKAPDADDPQQYFFAMVKQWSVFAFFTSEIGAHAMLRVDPAPGPFRAAVPVGATFRCFYEDDGGVPLIFPRGLIA
jgi:hypothetical protein